MSDAKFKTHVPAYFYGGGPLDGTNDVIPLDRGRLPQEWRCLMPLPPITAEVSTDQPECPPLPLGVYRLNSARSADDPEGFPGDMVWVTANYRWIGER